MPRVKQNCPKKMKWEGGVERPCTPGEDDADSSDGDTSVASGSSGGGGVAVQASTATSTPDEAAGTDVAVPVTAAAAATVVRLLQDKELQLAAAASSAASLLEQAAKANHATVSALLVTPEALVASSGGRELQSSPSARGEMREPPPSVRSASRASSDLSSGEPKTRHFDSEDENHCATEEILDFSKKRCKSRDATVAVSSADPASILNLSKPAAGYDNASSTNNELSPLDLSCSRKRTAQPLPVSDNVNVKHQRTSEFPKNWNPSNFPFYNNIKATKDEWNGGVKTPIINVKKFPETSKSLNELSKLGEDMFRSQMPPRQTAWQSHWVNKGSMEKNKEVFKCVWCKSSFHTLAQLTTHMKETSHCNSNAPATSQSANSAKSDLNLIIKETMPLPRKLVRGQDVWLGKGAEQTRQILKCMWCGQSFRSLAEMTSHMQQTQHYTNIISQEQIISWKSSDENAAAASAGGVKATTSGQNTPTPTPPPSSQQSHVTAVLTCKVCDQAFSSLKDLSAHMVKNSHYKEHIMRSITESGGRRRQNREKRKKSLPVRKLLELERAQHELNSTKNGSEIKKIATTSKISCEKCGEKIDTAIFVEHIRLCVGNSRNLLKSALLSNDSIPTEKSTDDKTKDASDSPQTANPASTSPSVLNAIEQLIEKSFDSRNRQNFQSMPNPNLGSSILKRLGIDESSDYTKPIVDAGNISLIRNYQQASAQLLRNRERSGSESSSRSQTPDRKSNISQQVTPVPATVDDSSQPKPSPDSPHKLEPLPKTPSPSVKERASPKSSSDDEGEAAAERPKKVSTPVTKSNERTPSPAESGKSTPDRQQAKSPADPDTPAAKSESSTKSLNALSNMFDNLSGKSSAGVSSENGSGAGGAGGPSSGAPGSSHPLAALQKLCDYTDRTTASTVTTTSTTNTNPGAILAFTWACNDAMVNNAESAIIKCAFCDTPFISKGAYRHHLSKMHFVKDGNVSDAKATSSTSVSSSKATASSAPSPPLASTSSESNNSAAATKSPQNNTETSTSGVAVGSGSVSEESPHSKFLKYTELAKQLSSKYV